MIRLGSNSKSRAELLRKNKIDFIQTGGTFDEEQIATNDALEFVIEATNGKYEELYNIYGYETYPLLVADSVVCCENKLLRKAKSIDDARNMLELQSGNRTKVVTCMIFRSYNSFLFDVSQTEYIFYPFEKNDLDIYLKSGECMGKAGAIMVEGFCKSYIKEVNGYESTAMGLCVEKLLPFL